jgi:hypothetical protein
MTNPTTKQRLDAVCKELHRTKDPVRSNQLNSEFWKLAGEWYSDVLHSGRPLVDSE